MINLERLLEEKPVARKAVMMALDSCGESDFEYLMRQCDDDPAARIIAGLQSQLVEQRERYEGMLSNGGCPVLSGELDEWKKRVVDLVSERDRLRHKVGNLEGQVAQRDGSIGKLKERVALLESALSPYVEADVIGCDGVTIKRGDTVYGGDGTEFSVVDITPFGKYEVSAVRVADGAKIPLKAGWLSHVEEEA